MSYYEAELVGTFFNRKLDADNHKLVFFLSDYWGRGKGLGHRLGFYIASSDIQERLIQEFGYLRCPCCQWATTNLDNHPWCQAEIEFKINND